MLTGASMMTILFYDDVDEDGEGVDVDDGDVFGDADVDEQKCLASDPGLAYVSAGNMCHKVGIMQHSCKFRHGLPDWSKTAGFTVQVQFATQASFASVSHISPAAVVDRRGS